MTTTALAPIFNELSDQISDKLRPYSAKLSEMSRVNEHDAPVFLKIMIDGLLVTGQLISSVSYKAEKAKINRRTQEALAAENFRDYAKAKGIKGTVDERNHFINVQDHVLQALEEEAAYEAMMQFLMIKKESFRMAHDDVKKFVYFRNDPNDRSPVLS